MRYSGAYCVKKRVSGVYALVHRPTGLIYVGSSYRCIYSRFKWHFVMLRQGRHVTRRLQEIWTKREDFIQIILELCDGKELCRERENFWKGEFSDHLLNSDLSEAAKARWKRPEYRKAVSEAARADAIHRHKYYGGLR